SSRRRHTSSYGDWSSDVCSSDLVTGADGFIGSTLTEKLVRRGDKVTALALYNSFDQCGWLDDLSNLDRSKLTIIRGDVRDAAFRSEERRVGTEGRAR